MVVVKVELHSAIDGSVKTIGLVKIINDGTGTTELGNYVCKNYKKASGEVTDIILHEARITSHRRLAKPVLNLVKKALTCLGY